MQKKMSIDASSLAIVSIDIQPQHQLLLTSGLDSKLRTWNLETGELIQSIDASPVNTWKAVFQPHKDGLIATTGQGGGATFWNGRTGNQVASFKTPSNAFTTALTFTRDGSRVAVGNKDGLVSIFDVGTGKLVRTFEAHFQTVRSVAFTPDSATLITASDDMTAAIFDTKDASKIGILTGHTGGLTSLAVSPSGKFIATGSADKTVKLYNFADRECVLTLHHHTAMVTALDWDDKLQPERLLSVGDDRSLIVYRCLSQ